MTEIAKPAATSTNPQQQRPGGIAFAAAGPTFGGILSGFTKPASARWAGTAGFAYRPARGASSSHATWVGAQPSPRKTAAMPETAHQALQKAMALENVPVSWQSSLQYIMARESGGNVGIRNPRHSARGLYQLTAANYHFNPRGKDSFGNAVEEAQGGIRYIKQRYKTAENAFAFWQEHRWY